MRPAGASNRRREAHSTQHPADWSIPGDQQEKERIQLEREVLDRIGSLDYAFESTDTHSRGTGAGTENNDDNDRDFSVEYGRHRGTGDGAYSPGGDLSISSFTHRGHGPFDHTEMSYTDHSYTQPQTAHQQQQQPQAQARGFRQDGEDESAFKGGDTLSTAQHHASAVTLGAGLGGYAAGPFSSHTPSRSNIATREFDPERKLTDLLAARGALNMLDESTAFAQNRPSKRSQSNKDPTIAHSFGTGDPIIVEDTAELDRALESGRVAFENAAHAERYQSDPGNETSSDPEGGVGDSESSSSFSFQPKGRAGSRSPQLRPPSAAGKPSDAPQDANFGPKRSRSAQDQHKAGYHSAAQAGEREKHAAAALSRSNPQQHPQQRAPPTNAARPRSQQQQRTGEDDVARLPDMTGLTSAVMTPLKAARRYLHAKQSSPNAAAVRVTVDRLAHKIRELETENVTSRRRVRELEHDLEKCRADVIRERTRVQIELQKEQHIAAGSSKDRKGKAKAVHVEQLIDLDDDDDESPIGALPQDRIRLEARYQEALEAKKDLEKTVAQLRAQLGLMTTQLEEQKQAVEDLQARREDDEVQILQRSNEVNELRADIEHLGVEVRRLRELIEAKLRERRHISERYPPVNVAPQVDGTEEDIETQLEESHAVPDTEYGGPPTGWYAEDVETNPGVQPPQNARRPSYERKQRGPLSTVTEADEPPTNEGVGRPASRMYRTRGADLGEDDGEGATGRESQTRATMGSSGRPPRRFINIAELDQIESEVEERRSVRSFQASVSSDTIRAGPSPAHQPGPSRSNAPKAVRPLPVTEAFPQIRGSKMERLFFSLPDHDEMTCRTCRHSDVHRRPRATVGSGARRTDPRDADVDQTEMLNAAVAALGGARRHEHADEDALPPQAVLARLLRELEDDFTHHKSMYLELAEQYGLMDPASNVLKRNILADHLREIIDLLEKKGDQIAALYNALKLRRGVQDVVEGVRLAYQHPARGKARART